MTPDTRYLRPLHREVVRWPGWGIARAVEAAMCCIRQRPPLETNAERKPRFMVPEERSRRRATRRNAWEASNEWNASVSMERSNDRPTISYVAGKSRSAAATPPNIDADGKQVEALRTTNKRVGSTVGHRNPATADNGTEKVPRRASPSMTRPTGTLRR